VEHYKAIKKQLRRSPVKVGYESEKIPFTVIKHKNYRPDFPLYFPDGHVRLIEIKGYLRPDDRAKMKMVKEQHPDIDLRIVFQKDNKLNAQSQTTYTQWARKLDIPYAVGHIPKEWYHRKG
jgi:hypothetical protein